MKWILTLSLVVGGLAVTGCKKKASGGGGPPDMVVQVVAVEARRQSVSETLSLVGTLTAKEMVEIKSEAEGTVEQINFKEGQRVEQGQLLLKLDESKWSAILAEAEANFKLSKANYERSQQLFKDKLISQQEFEQIASQFQANQAGVDLKKRELKDARIYAPFSGTVGGRNVSPGQVISKNTTLTWLVDLDWVKAEFNVPERSLNQVRVGQAIEVGVATFPGETFKGEVYFIAPFVDTETRTALVKAGIKNPELKLKPGMFANLTLTLTVRENAVVIPEVALMPAGEQTSVMIVGSDQTAQIRPVKVGSRLAGQAEVLSGLQGGEQVIVEGVQKARPGGKVKLAPAAAAAAYSQIAGEKAGK